MASPAPAAPQRVCPHCATVAYTTESHCPYCRRSYRRSVLPAVAAMLLVTTALILGGVYYLLTEFGDTLDAELDAQVETVQDDFDRDVRGLERSIRRELDQRFPAAPTAP